MSNGNFRPGRACRCTSLRAWTLPTRFPPCSTSAWVRLRLRRAYRARSPFPHERPRFVVTAFLQSGRDCLHAVSDEPRSQTWETANVRRHSYRYQRTIARPVELTGIGFLTGASVRLRFRPAPPSTGVVFVRSDLRAAQQ